MSSRTNLRNRAQGPVIVSFQARPKDERDRFVGYYVDIGHLRGTEVALTFATIADIEGSNKHTVRKLAEAGVLTEVVVPGSGRQRFARFDIGRSLADYYVDWEASLPLLTTHEEFDAYRDARRRCKIPADAPHSPRILEAVFQKLLEIGNFNKHEVNGLIPLVPAAWPPITKWLKVRIAEHARINRSLRVFAKRPYTTPAELPVTWELFKAALPDAFADLPRTCLDPHPRNQRDRPSRRFRERVWQLSRLIDAGSLYAIIRSARGRRPDEMLSGLAAIQRVEDIMFIHKPKGRWTRNDYHHAMQRYAIVKDILPEDGDRTRIKTVYRWRAISRTMRRYCRQHDPRNRRGIRNHLPPLFRISRSLKAELRATYAHLPQERIDDRKTEAHQAFAELDAIHDAARNRRDEMRRIGSRVREAETQIPPDADFLDFPIEVPTLDDRGMAIGDMQIETFRLWRVAAAWRSFDLATFNRTRAAIGERERKGFRDGFVVEHLHTEGLDGSDPITCWMVRLAKLGVFVCPAELPLAVRIARHEEIRSKGLPGFRANCPGLLAFASDGATLARSGLDHGRYFVPLEQAEMAMRFAFVALDTVAQAYSRMQEVQQITRTSWERAKVVPGKIHMTQMVWPKIEAGVDLGKEEKVPITVTDELLGEILDLCDLHVERCGLDEFPTMQPADPLRWKCGPAEYTNSWNGQALHAHHINLFLRYLLAGWPPFTLHDFRHAEAEEDASDGVPEYVTQTKLGHSSPVSTRTYTRLPDGMKPAKESAADVRRANRIERRAAKRRGAGGNPREISEKRRAERVERRRGEKTGEA